MSRLYALLLGAGALCAASAASAATTVIDLSSPSGDRGAGSKTYSDGAGHSVIATGYASNGGLATNLYGKSDGGDEIGLGLTSPTEDKPTNGDPSGQNEIQQGAFIQLAFTNFIGVNSVLVHFGSTTAGETWRIFGSNTADSLGTVLLTATNDEANHDLVTLGGWGTYQFYDFQSLGTSNGDGGFNSGNVLLGNITLSTAVPEPATWAMMLVGFGGIGLAMRRRRKPMLGQIA